MVTKVETFMLDIFTKKTDSNTVSRPEISLVIDESRRMIVGYNIDLEY